MEQGMDNFETIYYSALNHFRKVIDTLSAIEKLNQNTLGLEGWFRVELVKSLEGTKIIERISNKGADIKMIDGTELELKAAKDLNFGYLVNGAKNCPCLFLGKPRGKKKNLTMIQIKKELEEKANSKVLLEEIKENWYLGLIY